MLGSTYTVGKPGSLRVLVTRYYDEYSYHKLGLASFRAWGRG